VLDSAEKVYIQTHFNHPREVTPEAARVCKSLLRRGMMINNHSVLLKGVNDDLGTMRSLLRALLRAKVRPYYLFHCDPVIGAGHFRTSVWKGLEIIEGLRGHMSGLGIPTYVVDSPHGGGKIPVMPNYLISYSDHKVVLRNYEGYISTYEEPPTYQRHDTAACAYCNHERPEPGQSGVLGLLEGERMWIEPRGFSETHTRGNTEAHRLQDPSKWVPFGVGALDGRSGAPLPVIEGGVVPPTPEKVYGPGEEPRPREGEPTASAHGELL
jgi:lysine 2,3-aminomutase